MQLQGKIAVVTASGGEGSGRAEACRLAAEGCKVVVSDIHANGGRAPALIAAEDPGYGAL